MAFVTDLQNLDLSALSGHVRGHVVEGFQAACEAAGQLPDRLASSASWTDRYKLNAFAHANGLDYAFQVDPRILPGREKNKPYYAPFAITDVLTSHTEPA